MMLIVVFREIAISVPCNFVIFLSDCGWNYVENLERFQILDNVVELLCTYRVISIAVLHFLLPLTLILKNVSPSLNFDLNIYFSTSYLGPPSFLLLIFRSPFTLSPLPTLCVLGRWRSTQLHCQPLVTRSRLWCETAIASAHSCGFLQKLSVGHCHTFPLCTLSLGAGLPFRAIWKV